MILIKNRPSLRSLIITLCLCSKIPSKYPVKLLSYSIQHNQRKARPVSFQFIFFTGNVPRTDQTIGRMRFKSSRAVKNIRVPNGDLECMLSCYVNIHFESKCYDYYVKEKVINDLDCHDYRCSLYQASAHFIDGAINLKRGNAVFFLRRQRKTGLHFACC